MAAGAALRLLLAGLCLRGWGAAEEGAPPPLPCTLLGPGGVPSPRPALLRLWGRGAPPPPDPDAPRDRDSDVIFDVTDPWEALAAAWAPPGAAPHCELSPTAPAPWAPAARSPPGLGGPWWVTTLATPTYGVTALLQGRPRPATPAAAPAATAVTAALSVFTATPELGGSPGSPLDLHCAFAAAPGPFALEWRHRHRGAGRRLLTYDSATAAAPVAAPGVQLLLGTTATGAREVTLRLAPLALAHRGTYVCAIFLPHAQAQQLLRLRVLEPPKVTLSPAPLVVAAGSVAELRCETSGYFPLDVEVRWLRRAGGTGKAVAIGQAAGESWSSGHRQGPGGTFSRSSGLRVGPARPRHHGDVYVCVVTHPALAAPLRVQSRLEVAGAGGPAVEDAVGLGLVAFVLGGLWLWLGPARRRPDPDPKKTQ